MFDWIAGGLELSGSWNVGNKKRIGFILNLLGCLIWILVAFTSRVYGLWLVVVPACYVNIRNFIKWGKKKRQKHLFIGSKNIVPISFNQKIKKLIKKEEKKKLLIEI